MGRQAIRQTDPDYFALAVASYILGGGSSSRLYGRVREQEGLAYSVWSDVAPARYGAWLTVGAQTRAAAGGKVIDLLHDEMARMGREPVSDRELELAKAFLIGSFPLRLDTTAKVASFIVATEAQGLGLDYADRYREAVARVTTADVQRVGARLFAPDSLSRLIEHTPDMKRIPVTLVDQNVDAIRAIIRESARPDIVSIADTLTRRLREVTDEFLAHENRERPDYLDGILAPSIAPSDPSF